MNFGTTVEGGTATREIEIEQKVFIQEDVRGGRVGIQTAEFGVKSAHSTHGPLAWLSVEQARELLRELTAAILRVSVKGATE